VDASWKPAAKVAGFVLGAAALVPLAYYGLTFIVSTRCPECDARLDIVKRSGNWEPDLVPADEV
jgi:hypothetical protein